MNEIVALSGYDITEPLYRGSRTLVHRGIRTRDAQPVVIKVLRNPFPSFTELMHFHSQYAIAKHLNQPSIGKMLALESHSNRYALVMEDFGGISLKERLSQIGNFGLSLPHQLEFLKIAVQLAEALAALIQQGVIHKNIKPANILLHLESQQIQLIDFSIAAWLPRDTQDTQHPQSLKGSLPYLSPEQTGQINRKVDYRSDFYALGVTFYELLTGQLPFISNDPTALVHCHFDQVATPVHEINPQVPVMLSAIVHKLMAKKAEDRYQSALGLKHDLACCLRQLEETGRITDFELGARDLCDRLTISTLLSRSGASLSDSLDFAAVIQAAQSLSSHIQFNELIEQLTQVILKQAGADECVLVLPQDDRWQVSAIATPSATQLGSDPLKDHPDVAVQLIQYVKRTRSVVVIDNLDTDLPVIDDYLIEHQPKSVACLPMLNQGYLVGIIYLKNQLTAGVFTCDRLTVINFLCTQAAISLENARLYAHEQAKSQTLQQSLAELQDSELRFRNLFAKSPDAILLLGNEGFIACNQAAVHLFGYTHPEQITSLHPSAMSPQSQPDGQSSFEKANVMMSRALEHGSNQFEWMHQRADGQDFWAEVLLTVISYHGKQVFHSVVRDISDRKAAEALILKKSQELEKTLSELQNTQLQMIQNEKMSALGNLVAGVAHEMNNPLGFISTTLKQSQPMLRDIFEHLILYQQHLSKPSQEILDHAEEIDLDFSLEDLPKALNSMVMACDRLKNISTSLRTFSRADTDHPTACNLHEGIDSTLLILKHRLKANECRPAIQVMTDYGDLPLVECYAGQLNQVFMNLFANAIDVFDEASQGRTFVENQAQPHQLTIKTELLSAERQALIRIRDNGKGMSEDVQRKIFDHLFTTKAVGKGTGLGLAIARQIIVEAHHGSLEVQSTVGEGTEFCIRLPL